MNETPTEPKPLKMSLDDEAECIRRAELAHKCGLPSEYILITGKELRVLWAAFKPAPTPPPDAAGETARTKLCMCGEEMGKGMCLSASVSCLEAPDDSGTPECQKCGVVVNLRADSEHDGYCDSCAHDLLSALTSKLAELTKERDEQKAKLDYVQSMGLRFGMMKTSDKPEPYLAHTWSEDSDYERMFREWTDSIGWEDGAAKLKSALTEEKAIVSRIWAIYGNPCYESLAGKSIYDLIEKDRSALTTKTLELEESRLSPVAMKLAESQAEAHELSHKLAAKTLEAEGLRKDKERLDWLQGNTATFLSHYNRTGSVRLAIDAALSAAGEEARP